MSKIFSNMANFLRSLYDNMCHSCCVVA